MGFTDQDLFMIMRLKFGSNLKTILAMMITIRQAIIKYHAAPSDTRWRIIHAPTSLCTKYNGYVINPIVRICELYFANLREIGLLNMTTAMIEPIPAIY